MSDPPRDEFSNLEAFDEDPSPDADAMDRMLINLADPPSDPPDWANYSNLESLQADLYNPPTYPHPLSYMEQTLPEPDAVNAALDTTSSPPPPPLPTTPTTAPKKKASPKSPPKSRVPNAPCNTRGKSVPTNAANFKRQDTASRRQKPATTVQPQPSQQLDHHSPRAQQPQTQAASSSIQRGPAASTPTGIQVNRRDSDLLAVIRRLEASISTLDVSARLCLRDALLSLSNKASNPQVPPTPEQEAMNRAAEYLVLRMLFLSGQQVMHTAPGTASTPYPGEAGGNRGGDVMATDGDGTVAASTGTAGNAAKGEENTVKLEEKLPDVS